MLSRGADTEAQYGDFALSNDGLEVVPVPFAERKEAGIENLARFLNHGRLQIAEKGDLKVVIRQVLRPHRNDTGKVVKVDDHGPDALMCAMLHYRFEDEFDSPMVDLYTGSSREQRRVTDKPLEACGHDYPPLVRRGHGASMGVSVGSPDFYVVISALREDDSPLRKAMFIGRVGSFDELDALRARFEVMRCAIDAHAEPHRVSEWTRRGGHGGVFRLVYLNDGISRPAWDNDQRLVAVDGTYALDAAYEDIEAGRWWLIHGAAEIDDGEFFAQMKAPKRERDLSTGQLRFRWSESRALEHFRHAHAFDHRPAST